MEHIAIVIADEHINLRNLIVARLEQEYSFQIVGLANTSASVICCALQTRPRLLLLDPRMQDGQGLAAIRRLRVELPAMGIVVLTAFCETALKIELTKLGVHFILNKGVESCKLVEVLHRAAQSTQGNAPQTNLNEELTCLIPQ